MYAIFMALRAISTTPGLIIVIFIDSQTAIKAVSGYNLFPSKLDFECKQLINSLIYLHRKRSRSPMDPISLRYSWKRTSRQAGQTGFEAVSTLPYDASSKRQATSQGQIVTKEIFHSYRPGCWQILVLSARWPKTCSAFCPI
ncbi:hypothetical protein TNCV_4422801 [Trichonephila clavipes]|nr:hypothetical protein TNCV_4422801 [Trichonephila clavipes]